MEILGYFVEILKALIPFKSWFYKQAAWVAFTEPADHGQVANTQFVVHGTYRWLFGRTLVLFRVEDHNYFFQGTAVRNPTHKTWHKDVWIGPLQGHQYSIVVAAITSEFSLVTNYYGRVHELLLERQPRLDVWLPFEMFPQQIPPGFFELDRIHVTRS